MDKIQAKSFIDTLLANMVKAGGADLFITAGFPAAMKLSGKLTKMTHAALTIHDTQQLAESIMTDKQIQHLREHKGVNFAIALEGVGRFRCNVFMQRMATAMVLRSIPMTIPSLDDLNLPETLKDLSMTKRGLIILVGATGSGKSTTLAAMVDWRNEHSAGHIITIEDPIEFLHHHKGCIVNQREVGIDSTGWEDALKDTLRQAPDVILMGEIRDRETMEHAVAFAETGHLALATLHANSANQAIDRIVNFFPEERRAQLLMDLSLNMRAIISQRLIPKKGGKGRAAAIEVLINTPTISSLILEGSVGEIKEAMSKSGGNGMQTFDQALFNLHEAEMITLDDALRNADSANNLRLEIKLKSRFKSLIQDDTSGLAVV